MKKILITLALTSSLTSLCLASDESQKDPVTFPSVSTSTSGSSSLDEATDKLTTSEETEGHQVTFTSVSPSTSGSSSLDGATDDLAALKLDSKTTQQFIKNPDNYQTEGGIWGFLGTKTLTPEALQAFLSEEFTKHMPALKQNKAVTLALEKQQAENDELQKKLRRAEDDLEIEKALLAHEEKRSRELLTTVAEKDVVVRLQEDREKQLKHTLSEIEKIVRAQQEDQEKLDDARHEKQKLELLLKDKTQEEKLVEKVKQAIAEKQSLIKELEQKIAEYKQKILQKEEEKAQLQQTIKRHDYYQELAGIINDREVTDEELALRIFSVTNFLRTDLDELSKGREERLIRLIVEVTKPEGEAPFPCPKAYKGKWRLLGNKFVEGGLVWEGGKPIDYDKIRYSETKFGRSSAEMQRKIMNELGRQRTY